MLVLLTAPTFDFVKLRFTPLSSHRQPLPTAFPMFVVSLCGGFAVPTAYSQSFRGFAPSGLRNATFFYSYIYWGFAPNPGSWGAAPPYPRLKGAAPPVTPALMFSGRSLAPLFFYRSLRSFLGAIRFGVCPEPLFFRLARCSPCEPCAWVKKRGLLCPLFLSHHFIKE